MPDLKGRRPARGRRRRAEEVGEELLAATAELSDLQRRQIAALLSRVVASA